MSVALQDTPQTKGSVATTIGGCHPLPAAILKVLDLRQEARDRVPDWAPPLGLAGNRLLDNRLFASGHCRSYSAHASSPPARHRAPGEGSARRRTCPAVWR